MDWENIYKTLKAFNWIILLVLGSLSACFMTRQFTAGILVGGLLIMANFHALQHTIRQAFLPKGPAKGKKAPVIAKYYLRLGAMAGLIYFFISQEWVDPVGLAIGLSIVVIGIVGLGIQLIRKTFSEETV